MDCFVNGLYSDIVINGSFSDGVGEGLELNGEIDDAWIEDGIKWGIGNGL